MDSRRASLFFALLISSSILAQEPRTFLGKDLPTWREQLRSADAQDRHEAAWALAQLGGPALESLQQALTHEDAVVRYWAIHGLGHRPLRPDPGKARLRWFRSALADPAPAVRIEAAAQLALHDELDEALPVLIAALDEPQESAAMQAAAALAALGKKAGPARAKLTLAEKNGGEYVKRLSARALANLDQE
jgi:HEAT repeat protein